MSRLSPIIALAQHNCVVNPVLQNSTDEAVVMCYVHALRDEVQEMSAEVKTDNEVYLIDELADVVWDLTMLLCLLQTRGYITNIDTVLARAEEKYRERSKAFTHTDDVLWQEIKQTQKQVLQLRHQEKYGH